MSKVVALGGLAVIIASIAAGVDRAIVILDAQNGNGTATVTVGDETFTFRSGECKGSGDSFTFMAGDGLKGERFELNIPNPVRARDPTAVKPTKDGTYTQASIQVIPAGSVGTGKNWHAGGRTARESDISITLKNNRRGGEFSGRTDGSPRRPIKGSFSC
jgi:hypothetical protein